VEEQTAPGGGGRGCCGRVVGVRQHTRARATVFLEQAGLLESSATLANTAVTANAWPDSQWWTQLQDPQLSQLIAEGLAGSRHCGWPRRARARALAQAQVAQSARLPQADGKGDVTRERFPERSLVPPPYGGSWDTLSELQAYTELGDRLLG